MNIKFLLGVIIGFLVCIVFSITILCYQAPKLLSARITEKTDTEYVVEITWTQNDILGKINHRVTSFLIPRKQLFLFPEDRRGE